MALAHICLARNDLDDNLLQVMDLWPNSSLGTINTAYTGQTGYVSWMPQTDTVVTHDAGAGVTHSSAVYYGLAAYMVDNVEDNDNLNIILTDVRANNIAAGILTAVAAGTALTLAAIDALIQVQTGGGASGLTTAHSTGSVAEVLQIVAGEAYYLPAESVLSGGAAAFVNPHYRKGTFLAANAVGTITCVAPDVGDDVIIGGVSFHAQATESALLRNFCQVGANSLIAQSLCTVINDPRNQAALGAANTTGEHRTVTVTARPLIAGSNIVVLVANQTGTNGAMTLATTDAVKLVISGATLTFVAGAYRGHRLIADTGELHLSKLTGNLSHLTSATYAWVNPAFTYGAAGTALTVAGGNILAGGVGRAVVVYDAAGNVI